MFGKCRTPRQHRLNVLGNGYTVGVLCACRKAEEEAQKSAWELQQLMECIRELRYNGFPDRCYELCRFDADDRRNGKISDAMQRYADTWDEMCKHNIGLLLHGPVGTGKTYFAACIANTLIDRGIPA